MAHRPYPNRERALRQIGRHYEPGQRALPRARETDKQYKVGEYRISTR
ncbi:hypothetical protein [Streptomyces canus]